MPDDRLPDPPIPRDADLRSFPYLPLHPQKLRDSRLTVLASDAEFRAWVLLLCASWHQTPAGSLPTDERELAALAGFGRDADGFRAIGEMKLRGWHEHSDGRLYHDVFTEDVLTALKTQRGNKTRTNAATAARQAQRDVQRDDERDVPPTEEKGREGKRREGTGQDENGEETRAQDAPSFDFERIKNAYPKRAGSQPWKRAISAANARIKDGADFEDMVAGAERYAAYCQATDKTSTELVMHAATFLGPDEHFRNEWAAPKKPETKAEAYLRRTRDFEERYENGRQTGGATVSADGVDLRPAVDVPT